MVPPRRRPRFEKIPGAEMPADWRDVSLASSIHYLPNTDDRQCPANAPPGMRPIYEKIPEAELPADVLDVSLPPFLYTIILSTWTTVSIWQPIPPVIGA